jgi:hypothetical protein
MAMHAGWYCIRNLYNGLKRESMCSFLPRQRQALQHRIKLFLPRLYWHNSRTAFTLA